MRVIILAAGKSSRIASITSRPKCLLEIDGRSILERTLDLVNETQTKPEVLVVTGCGAEYIETALAGQVATRFFPDYDRANNLWTLHYVRDLLDCEVVIFFSDVIFAKEAYRQLLASPGEVVLAVDRTQVRSGTMRVSLRSDTVWDLGSHLAVPEGHGNFVGIAKFSKRAALMLRDIVEQLCLEGAHLQDYYTIALPYLRQAGIELTPMNVAQSEWIEIDTPDDYKRAEAVYTSRTSKIVSA